MQQLDIGRHEERAEGLGRGQSYRASGARLHPAEFQIGSHGLGLDPLGMGEQGLPHRGESHAGGQTVGQPHIHRRLQPGKAPHHRAVIQPQGARRRRNAARPANRDEDAQVIPVRYRHFCTPPVHLVL